MSNIMISDGNYSLLAPQLGLFAVDAQYQVIVIGYVQDVRYAVYSGALNSDDSLGCNTDRENGHEGFNTLGYRSALMLEALLCHHCKKRLCARNGRRSDSKACRRLK